jgi:NAD(P)-dependent dehydrogenase (short-subunit alcohol dehydrogenase family)
MVRQKYGRIVNIASIAGKEGNPNAVAYSASKAGVISPDKIASQRTRVKRRARKLRHAGRRENRDFRSDDQRAH